MSKQIEATRIEWVNRHTWLDGCDLQTEYRQAIEEGRDLARLQGEFQRLLAVPKPENTPFGGQRDGKWLRDAAKLMDKVQRQPYRPDYAYVEPSDLKRIKAARPEAAPLPAWTGARAQFLDRLHGGLMGRACGCLLGKPVEGFPRDSIRINAAATGNWPLADYFALPTDEQLAAIAAQNPKRTIKIHWKEVLRQFITHMVPDDDTNYTVIGYAIVKEKKGGFTPSDVASFWGGSLPIFHTCTAERIAYRNFTNLIVPPLCASYRNPYREWIGAQIRADYFGWANPGNPQRAADWAWRDACISHVKNGIYGEMWVAAMLASAYVLSDPAGVIRAGLAQIPSRCRLAEDVAKILAIHEQGVSYDEAINQIHQQWNEADSHHWCHTNSNAQIVAAALLYGGNDYEKTITFAVMPGFDTDCNGATAGSVWGIMHGISAIPAKWSDPLHDRIRTGVYGFQDQPISQLASDMVGAAIAAV